MKFYFELATSLMKKLLAILNQEPLIAILLKIATLIYLTIKKNEFQLAI